MTAQIDAETIADPNLPQWPGASHCYSKAYRILAAMAKRGHATPAVWRRGQVVVPGRVSDDMRTLIDALNKGDEESIKGLLMLRRVYFEEPTP